MEDSSNLWEAWNLAKAYRCRPSDLYDIQDPVTAWSFDRAVYRFGTTVDSELRAAGEGSKNKSIAEGKRQMVLAKYLGTTPKFRDPAAAKTASASSTEAGTVQL